MCYLLWNCSCEESIHAMYTYLCISSARTDKKFGWQQITSRDANKEVEMMKFQNNNNDKNIL